MHGTSAQQAGLSKQQSTAVQTGPELSIRFRMDGILYFVTLDKSLRLTVLNRTDMAVYKTEITDDLVAKLKSDLSLESDNRSFFELFRQALLSKTFSLVRTPDDWLELNLKYKVADGLFLKGKLQLQKVATLADPRRFGEEIV